LNVEEPISGDISIGWLTRKVSMRFASPSVSHACAAVRRAPASFTRSHHFNAPVHIGVVLGDLATGDGNGNVAEDSNLNP
jgi:hypothetical protein